MLFGTALVLDLAKQKLTIMWTNFFKVAFRNIFRHRLFSFINLAGLTISMAAAVLILLFVRYEWSYDRFHEHGEDIYRIRIMGQFQGNSLDYIGSASAPGPAFYEEIPDIVNFVRMSKDYYGTEGTTVKVADRDYIAKDVFHADSSFFEIFTFPLIHGEADKVLNEPNTVVFSESTARKYFGTIDVVGDEVELGGHLYQITGVCEDAPANSHFHFTMIASLSSTYYVDKLMWLQNDNLYTYFKMKPGTDIVAVNKKVTEVSLKHISKEMQRVLGVSWDELQAQGNSYQMFLQPLFSIHLHSNSMHEIEPNGSFNTLIILMALAGFILFIAIINYMNLSTARSTTRGKEVGLRKVLGAEKPYLRWQFLMEAILTSIMAFIPAMIIVELVLPYFNNFANRAVHIGYFESWYILPLLLFIPLLIGVLAGQLSASKLAAVKIIPALRSEMSKGKKSSAFRNGLVVLQFAISIFLFIATATIYMQIQYLQDKDLGFEKEGVLVVKQFHKLGNDREAYRSEVKKLAGVKEVAFSNRMPGEMHSGFACNTMANGEKLSHVLRMGIADDKMDDVLGLEMVHGRFFRDPIANDSLSVVVNETAARRFGFGDNPVGQQIITSDGNEKSKMNIIGVVKDYHFRSLHDNIGGLAILPIHYWSPTRLLVKFEPGNVSSLVTQMSDLWQSMDDKHEFIFAFLDNYYEGLYKEEQQMGKLMGLFSLLAIFIASLGLFGMASFMAEKRTKELGIRKTLGATTSSLVTMLLHKFTIWVVLANIIAWPVAWWFLKDWLANFAYHVEQQWWLFVLGALMALFIAVFTVLYQALKTARVNPVNSLRYE